jgi:uncharacterized protein
MYGFKVLIKKSFILFLGIVLSFFVFSSWGNLNQVTPSAQYPQFKKTRAYAAQEVEFPDPEGFVNDFADIISSEKEEELEQDLRDFAKSESTEIFVITTDELPKGTDIYTFVPELTDANSMWMAGQEEYDNGVIFTVVVESRQMAIDVGYGLEGALPDITAKHILDDEVRPHFKNDDYESGIKQGVESIKKEVKGEYVIQEDSSNKDSMKDVWEPLVSCFFIGIFFVFPYVGAFLGRTKSWWLGGVLGLILGIVISGFVALTTTGIMQYLFGCFFVPALVLAGLFFDFIFSRNYKARKNRGLSTGWFNSWGGFSSGGSSSSGSIFSGGGGFSGGSGGSFGGGGARSSW